MKPISSRPVCPRLLRFEVIGEEPFHRFAFSLPGLRSDQVRTTIACAILNLRDEVILVTLAAGPAELRGQEEVRYG